jgi:hypothetical protein
MRKTLLPLITGLCLLTFVGCRVVPPQKKTVDVYIDGNGKFPSYLVGKWQTEQGDWEIAFKPNGTIEHAVISLGKVKITPGHTTTVPMLGGGKGTFTPGKWTVRYFQEQKQLIVEIVIYSFRIELGSSVVHGKTREFFSGFITENSNVWQAERYSYPEYFVNTDKYENYLLPADPNENPREYLAFIKANEQ